MAWELPDKERLARFWLGIKNKLADKYDKSGGEITGSVIIDGNLTLKIEDEDYDAVSGSPSLWMIMPGQ